MKNLLDSPKFAEVVTHFEAACKASRHHGVLADEALQQFGSYGPPISGAVRDHFPDTYKDELRRLARLVTEESDKAYAARPKRVRHETVRWLGQLVATRYGSGFYGPQPDYKSAK
jgi:hypothetical protein